MELIIYFREVTWFAKKPPEEIAKPTCAVCGKPVDIMEWWKDPARMGVVFRVKCHGQEEETFLPDSDFIVMDKIEPGVAFATPVKQLQ